MAKKEYRITGRCPYCGESLYEDEMCRCQFEDEIEIRTEVTRTTRDIISGSGVSPVPTAGNFCGFCGSALRPGEVCRCRAVTSTPKSSPAVAPGSYPSIKPMKKVASSSMHAGETSYSSKADVPASSGTTSALKSTMRKESSAGSTPASGFRRSSGGFLNKANDLD